jgi:hypothetical protein
MCDDFLGQICFPQYPIWFNLEITFFKTRRALLEEPTSPRARDPSLFAILLALDDDNPFGKSSIPIFPRFEKPLMEISLARYKL